MRNVLRLSLVLAALLPAMAQAQLLGGPKLTAKLYAAHDSISPGGESELAVELKISRGWHIYHPVILGTGLETEIDFELPAWATVGDLRFPNPHLGEDQGIEYLALDGSIVVLTTLKLAADAPLEPLEIKAKIFALACKKQCVPVDTEASLTLGVSEQPAAAENEELFDEARNALPKSLAEAEFLEGSRLLVSHPKLPIGTRATLAAVIRVKPEHHIQDRDPGVEGFIASRLLVQSAPGVKFKEDQQIWPKPHVRTVKGVGKVREQSGEFIIQAPFEISDEEFEPGPVRLRALFLYQACTDDGKCFPPSEAEAFFEFEVVPTDAPAVQSDDPIFEKLATQERADQSAGGGSRTLSSVLLIFLGAFVGGVILNIMPCVLPVISLKIFGFMQQAGDDRGKIFRMGLVYAAGIMASFAVLAVLMVFAGLAWGGLMQRPGFLIGLSALVFALALSLLGVFELQLPGAVTSAAGEAAGKEGYSGAFMNGILATLLATPCVGPFLGPAVGVLVQLPALVGAAGIMVVGLGLATPYVLLTAFPGWLRFLPKPGPWMVTFKQVVGFVLVIVVVWLLSILMEMVDHGTILGTLGLLCAVSMGCWLLGRITLSDSARRAATLWLLALVVMLAGGWTSFRVFNPSSEIPWQDWEPGIAERLAERGYTVYIDYTAGWCLTCQWNKAVVLETSRIAQQFKELGIYPVKADFTNRNAEMLTELRAHDRVGVPLNIIFPAGKPDEPIVLPEVLTKKTVLEALSRAGPSAEPPGFWTAPQ